MVSESSTPHCAAAFDLCMMMEKSDRKKEWMYDKKKEVSISISISLLMSYTPRKAYDVPTHFAFQGRAPISQFLFG